MSVLGYMKREKQRRFAEKLYKAFTSGGRYPKEDLQELVDMLYALERAHQASDPLVEEVEEKLKELIDKYVR